MKIKQLSYFDSDTQWNLEATTFKKITLLVGASGVGKTQILQSILRLQAITQGKPVSGIKWSIEFETSNGDNYQWIGVYESQEGGILKFLNGRDENGHKKTYPKIVLENLWLNGAKIISRNAQQILFNGQPTVKLTQDKSILYLLQEETLVAPAYKEFQKIIYSDQKQTKNKTPYFSSDFLIQENLLNRYRTIDAIRESEEDIVTKLYLTYHNAPEVMLSIKERFIDIFPFVIDIKIAPLNLQPSINIPSFLKGIPFIQIKEKNVKDWIIQPQISAGMYKTLLHLSELYLCSKGTVVLIDEFENSLGVNCIDELTADLQSASNRDLQFIITSHHPYIINQIHFKNWKVVTRNGNNVKTSEANSFADFSKSRQQAFVQLTQLEEFTTGIIH